MEGNEVEKKVEKNRLCAEVYLTFEGAFSSPASYYTIGANILMPLNPDS